MPGNGNQTAQPVPLHVPASNAYSPYDKSLPKNSPRREQFSSMPYHGEYIGGFPSPRSYSMDAVHHKQALSARGTSSSPHPRVFFVNFDLRQILHYPVPLCMHEFLYLPSAYPKRNVYPHASTRCHSHREETDILSPSHLYLADSR